jgi:hypothetical protein
MNIDIVSKNIKTKEQRINNTDNLIKRIISGKFWCLRDERGNCLNVAYTKGGLEWTTDDKGHYVYYNEGMVTEPFIPKKEILLSRGYKSKCEKKACDKANAMMYEQRSF